MEDVTLDGGLVRGLLEEQHPDLAGLELEPVDGGWDNRMWRLGGDLAVRLPRTPRAPSLLRKEHRWLPLLAPRLPLPVPVPVRVGEPTARFPDTWSVAAWVPGGPGDRSPITRGPHAAGALAGFLSALHHRAPDDAPLGPDRGVPLERLAEAAERGLATMDPGGGTDRLRRVWDDALAAPAWDRPPVWIHGDLHPANTVTADGTLAGVIDFGDMCAGDPATDLSAAWLLLPAGADAAFFSAYARADPATVRRARGWALLRALDLIAIGRAGDRGLPGGKPTWRPAGEAALARLPAEPGTGGS